MQIYFNVLDRQYNMYKEEYMEAVMQCLESGWYVLGKNVETFEQQFAQFIGSSYCVGVNSGLDALVLAFRALGIGKGDEVIVPANTYIASVLGITENGATPVFVEPDEYYNLNAEKIESAITKNTKAILIVHLYGQAANMKKICEIAHQNNLLLVEDCAQSHGCRFDGKMTGSFGDIGCFSFYPTKNLGAFGDGGALVTNNPQIAETLRMLRNYGSKVKYQNEIEGVNSRLDEIQAALLSVKLKHLEELTAERKKIAEYYLMHINNNKILLPATRELADHVWHVFVVRTQDRDGLQKYLLDKGIATQIHYPIPPHLSQCYTKLNIPKGSYGITESYAKQILSLPLYNGMIDEEMEYVTDVINHYY